MSNHSPADCTFDTDVHSIATIWACLSARSFHYPPGPATQRAKECTHAACCAGLGGACNHNHLKGKLPSEHKQPSGATRWICEATSCAQAESHLEACQCGLQCRNLVLLPQQGLTVNLVISTARHSKHVRRQQQSMQEDG